MTIAIDASALVEILARTDLPRRRAILDAVGDDPHWVVPEHFLLEVTNSLRGLWLGRKVTTEEFHLLIQDLAQYRFDVWPTDPLLPRIVELAPNATSYDAAYLALAEELDCRLVTADAKLAQVPGIRCRVDVAA